MGKTHVKNIPVDGAALKRAIKESGFALGCLSEELGHSTPYLSQQLSADRIPANTLTYICELIDKPKEIFSPPEKREEIRQAAEERTSAKVAVEAAQKAAETTESLLVRIESQDALIKALQAEVERLEEKLKTIDGEISMVIRRVYG